MTAATETSVKRVANRAGNGASIAAWLYLSVILGLGAWVAVGAAVFHWQPVVMTSGSMAPGFAAGDVVLLAGPGEGRLAEGRVVAYEREGHLVTHRVEEVLPDGTYVTQGDAFTMREPDRNRRNIAELLQLWADGTISLYVSETFPLERGAGAIAELAGRRARGKVVVVTPAGEAAG